MRRSRKVVLGTLAATAAMATALALVFGPGGGGAADAAANSHANVAAYHSCGAPAAGEAACNAIYLAQGAAKAGT
jgi:hypothetical protein